MKKIDKAVADAYFREKNRNMIIYFAIWFIVSFGVVLFAEPLSEISSGGFPFHYFMGAQGAVVTFIILLFVNAKVSDGIAAAAILANVVVSLATPAPSQKIQEEVLDLRYPEQMVFKNGEVWMNDDGTKAL